MINKKGITTKKVQYNKGKIILSKSHYNGISTYTESYYFSVMPFITLLFILAIITIHLTTI